jgi:adenine-specific DNA-methyltransferase
MTKYIRNRAGDSEKDYIFTTTQFITVEMLDGIHDEMKPDETLLIACKSFQSECLNRYPSRITIKQIPQILYGKCEFGKDDYSLNIVNAPKDEETEQYSSEDDNDENPLTNLFGE